MVLPCIGSETQSGLRPSRLSARNSGGMAASILSAPKRQMRVSRPGSLVRIEDFDQAQDFVRARATDRI